MLKTPARGKHCNHIQCFSLENYLKMMYTTEHKKFKCLICNSACFELEIDKFQLMIIERIRKKKLDVNELIFNNDV
jgi:E3 SUMO-protein ligase PIAS1